MVICGIYLIKSTKSKKVYVGSSIDIERRWIQHVSMLNDNCHTNIHLQRAWDKLGEDSFTCTVLVECDIDNLLHYEQKAIDNYREALGWGNMYNMLPNAESSRGKKHSAESKAKMSAVKRGKKHSEETKAKMSKSHMGNTYAKGCKHSLEAIANMSKSHMGNTNTLGFKHTQATRNKMSLGKMGNTNSLGFKHTQATKDKMSIAQQKRQQRIRNKTKEKL